MDKGFDKALNKTQSKTKVRRGITIIHSIGYDIVFTTASAFRILSPKFLSDLEPIIKDEVYKVDGEVLYISIQERYIRIRLTLSPLVALNDLITKMKRKLSPVIKQLKKRSTQPFNMAYFVTSFQLIDQKILDENIQLFIDLNRRSITKEKGYKHNRL